MTTLRGSAPLPRLDTLNTRSLRQLDAATLLALLCRVSAALCLHCLLRIAAWRARSRQRAHLAVMDAHMLRDIGLSRAEARREARKWFWQC